MFITQAPFTSIQLILLPQFLSRSTLIGWSMRHFRRLRFHHLEQFLGLYTFRLCKSRKIKYVI